MLASRHTSVSCIRSSSLARGGRPGRLAVVQTRAYLDPHRTLGIDVLADEACIKKAFRKLARQLHPDVCHTDDAERRFVEVIAAYELLTGKARGKEIQEPGETAWDWHDWYWQFRAQRTAAKQQRRGAAAAAAAAAVGEDEAGSSESAAAGSSTPHWGAAEGRHAQSQEEIGSQLAGLRQRSAIRSTRRRTQQEQQAQESVVAGPAAAAAAAAGGGEEESLCGSAPAAAAAAESTMLHSSASEGPCDGPEPPPPSGGDEGQMAGNVPPGQYQRRYAGTEDTRQHVANQIVGLRRKKAIQQKQKHADAWQGC